MRWSERTGPGLQHWEPTLRTLTTRILASIFIAFLGQSAGAFDKPQRMLTEEQIAAAVSGQVARSRSDGESMGESAVRPEEKTAANGLTFSGTFSFDRTGSTVVLRVARIDNESTTRTTGTLRLELWASSTRPANGQGFTGYRLATGSNLNPLPPRTFYSDVVRTTSFSEPPAGTYWMVMVLSEFSSSCSQSDGFCLTDSGVFSNQQTFGSAPPPPPSGNVTIISRAGSQCYENIPREVYDFLAQLLPGSFELHPSTTTCASLGMPFFAGLLIADTSIRVYTTDSATAQILCSTGVITSCATAPPPPPPPPSNTNYSDLWWNANESGWGISITHHTSGVAFVAWYTYDTSGNPKWYVASECRITNGACSGALYETNGPRFDQPFNPALVSVRNVGTISFTFSSANSGTMSYNVQGRTGVKAITRQSF
jgi:hypothetical protein